MTMQQFMAVFIIVKWIGAATGLWLVMAIVDLFTCEYYPRFQKYYGPILKWYSRIIVTVLLLILTFILLLLWETRSY